MIPSLFDYDVRREAARLRLLDRKMEMRARKGLAIQAALSEHPVSRYVRRLPYEPASYPAIEYLKVEEAEGPETKDSRVPRGTTSRKGPEGVPEPSVQEGSESSLQEGTESSLREGSLPSVQEGSDPSVPEPFIEAPYRSFIEWCLPAHDKDRPERKRCGFILNRKGGLVFSMCPNDESHFIKGKRRHCWSLRCPSCMNDTALKRGVAIERQLLNFKELSRKDGVDVGDIGHWVVSPPQELAKQLCQTKEDFDTLCKHVDDSMVCHGAYGGVTIFHPWRQKEEYWQFAPHFHILCYGRINTTAFRRANPGWLIKKVHPREKIYSIRHTASYLVTHMGLGMAEKDPDEVDWDMEALNTLIPGIKSPGATYGVDDWLDWGEDKGRMVGDLSGIDWEQWTMKKLYTEFKIRYWGGAIRSNIRTLGVYRQYKIRVCKECGRLLRTYDGPDDDTGSYIRYIRDNPVVVFARDFERASVEYLAYKDRLRADGRKPNIAEFSRQCVFTVCSLDLGLPMDNDIVLDHPFQEPDRYFLQRQRSAFGKPVESQEGTA